MSDIKYITEVYCIDSSVEFELGDDELSFALQMRAEYIKVEGDKKTMLFSIEFWTDWYDWSIPPYDEEDETEDDIIDWFNDNSLADGIVKDEYPELWDIDFYESEVPVVLFDREPILEIESAIRDIWNMEEYELETTQDWADNEDDDQFPTCKKTFTGRVEIAGDMYEFDFEVELSSMEQMQLFDTICWEEERLSLTRLTYADLDEKIRKAAREAAVACFDDETIEVNEEDVPVKSLDEFEACLDNLTFDYPEDMVNAYHNLQEY